MQFLKDVNGKYINVEYIVALWVYNAQTNEISVKTTQGETHHVKGYDIDCLIEQMGGSWIG